MQRSNLILLTVIAGLLFSLPYFRVAAPTPAPTEAAVDPQALSPSSLELAVREYNQTAQPTFASTVSASNKPASRPTYQAPRPLTYAEVALPIPPDPIQRRMFSALHVTETQRDEAPEQTADRAAAIAPLQTVSPTSERFHSSSQTELAFEELDRMFAEKEFVAQPQTTGLNHSNAIAGANAIQSTPSTPRSPHSPGNFASTRQGHANHSGQLMPLSESAQVTIGPMNVRLQADQDSNQHHPLAPPLNSGQANVTPIALPVLPQNGARSSTVGSQSRQRPRHAIHQPD